jgi:hypothetical protein
MFWSTALGIGLHEMDQLAGPIHAPGAAFQPVHLGRDVRHIAKLQGGGDVLAEEVDACVDVSGEMASGSSISFRVASIFAPRGKRLMRDMDLGCSPAGLFYGLSMEDLSISPTAAPMSCRGNSRGCTPSVLGRMLKMRPTEGHVYVLVRQGECGVLQGRGAGELLGYQNDQIGFGSRRVVSRKAGGGDIRSEVDTFSPRRRKKRESSSGVKVCHSSAGQPTRWSGRGGRGRR